MLRPALELAVNVARDGVTSDPPIDPPRSVRPFLPFKKRLVGTALRAVRRALDDDDEFRARVRDVAEEASIGRAGWLFLNRPDGWRSELTALEAEHAASNAARTAAAEEEADDRSARRRLSSVEASAREAEQQLARVRSELAGSVRALTTERKARREAEDERDALRLRVGSLESERDAAHRRASLAEAETQRLREQTSSASSNAEPAQLEFAAPNHVPAIDEARAAVSQARAAAISLGRALDSAARILENESTDSETAASEAPDIELPGADPEETAANPKAVVRLPVALPPGLFSDDPEVAGFLVRQAGAVLLVDGYNASLRQWPDVPISEQRQRLVDSLAALAARTGAEIHAVFDGSGGRSTSVVAGRRGVRVTFSSEEVEADEIILDLIDREPASRPVLIATDDRRVQRGAGAKGANVLTQAQLFGLLGLLGRDG